MSLSKAMICTVAVCACLTTCEVASTEELLLTSPTSINTGDTIDSVRAIGSDAKVNMTGGSIAGDFHLEHGSSLLFSGGEIGHDINVNQASSAEVSGTAIVQDDVYVYDSGSFGMTGGSVQDNVQLYSEATGLIEDGTISGNLGAHGQVVLELRGGNSSFLLWADGESEVHIYGQDLLSQTTGGATGNGRVTGEWDTGQPIEIDIDTPDTWSHITLHEIPEPTAIVLLGLGGLALLRRRRTGTAASLLLLVGLGMALLPAGSASAVDIETVPVGNPGNAGELSGQLYGPDRICGAVDYGYRIGKYEVTAGQYTEFLNAVAATDSYGLYNEEMDSSGWRGCRISRAGEPGQYVYSVADHYINRPVNYVSWADAARFTNWLHNGQPTGLQSSNTTEDGVYDLAATHQHYGPNGEVPDGGSGEWHALNQALIAVKRKPYAKWAIPSEDEWYKAAYHKNDGVTGNYFDYPTSSNTAPSNELNAGGNNATFYDDGFTIDQSLYPNQVHTTVGDHINSPSPYGTFDQGGNVWEWTEATIYGDDRSWRGGGYGNHDWVMNAADRSANGWPTDEGSSTGFRVTYVPEPATLLCLGLGGVSLIRRRIG